MALIKSYQQHHPYLQTHTDHMITCLFKNKVSSFGGAQNIDKIVSQFFEYIGKYSMEEMLIEPCNDSYYTHIQKISFDEASYYEITFEEITAPLLYHIPIYLMNKCVMILNNAFQCNSQGNNFFKMKAINTLVKTNLHSKFTEEKDDLQIIRLKSGRYFLVKFNSSSKMVNVYLSCEIDDDDDDDDEQSIKDIVRLRYNTPYQYIDCKNNNPNSLYCHQFYSGIWAIVFGIDILSHNDPISRNLNEKGPIEKWFYNFVQQKKTDPFPQAF